MAEQTENLTYRQLADRLGLSLEAARARVRRGGWLKITDNHGTIRVSVPVFALNKTPERTEHVAPDNTALFTLRDMMSLLQTELNEKRQEVSGYREENAVLKEQNAKLRETLARIEGERVHPTYTQDVHPVQRPVFTLSVPPEQNRSYGGYARRRWWWPFG